MSRFICSRSAKELPSERAFLNHFRGTLSHRNLENHQERGLVS